MIKKLYHGRIFYGWFIVAAAFIIMANSMGIVFNTASLFLKPISSELGFSRSAISATLTVRYITQMIVSLLSGKIFSKYKISNVMKVCTIVLAISFFSYSLVSSLALFYIITAIVSFSFTLISILPLSLILNNWFNDRIGTVMGIAFMGSGIGGMLYNSLAGKWILEYGWRNAYEILALIILFTIAPCVFLIIKIYPKDIGLRPLGESLQSNMDSVIQNDGVLLKDVIKTFKFWAIIICIILVSMSITTLNMTISPHLTDIGYTITYSANIVAICMGAIAIGKLILGYLYDKFGIKIATFISCFSVLLGLIGLMKFNSNIYLLILIIGSGIGCAHGTVGPPVMTQSLYGRRDYSAIYGITFAANAIGGALGPVLNGFTYDLTGNYIFSFKLMLVGSFISMIIYLLVLPIEKDMNINIRANA